MFLLCFVMNVFIQKFMTFFSISLPYVVIPIKRLSMVIICKFEILEGGPPWDIAAYPKFILDLWLYEG